MEKNNQPSRIKILSLIIIFILIITALFFLVWQKNKSDLNYSGIQVPAYSEPSFSSFVEAWNDKVRAYNLSDAHLLSSTNNGALLRELKKYTNNYSLSLPKNTITELQMISLDYPHSIWSMYKDFLTTYTGKKKYVAEFDWKSVNSSEDLQHLIQVVTGNNDFDESIKLLLASSDPCVYFTIYKTELRKRGLSRNYKKCNAKQIDNSKYPKLSKLIY